MSTWLPTSIFTMNPDVENLEDFDLTDPKQKIQAEQGVAEKIRCDLELCLFHDAEGKPWVRLLVVDCFETYAIESREMKDCLEKMYWQGTKSIFGKPELMPTKLLKETLRLFRATALYDGSKETVPYASQRISECTI